MKVLVITSDQPRHKYFVSEISDKMDVVGVVQESKRKTKEPESDIKSKHFQDFRDEECRLFGSYDIDGLIPKLCVERGISNSTSTFEWIKKLDFEIILLFGSGIIGNHILDEYSQRVINLHLGLSPYYRGVGTNFWPVFNREMACIGATIHIATGKVDAGGILAQIRPEIEAEDSIHTIGCKVIISATNIMPWIVERYRNDEIKPIKQRYIGTSYKKNDFTDQALLLAMKNIEDGLVDDYLSNIEEEKKKFPIIEVRKC